MFERNETGFVYLSILARRDKPAPLSGRTATGYGKKITCSFLAQTDEGGKFRRVYCAIYSNSGTCYIVKNGKRFIVKD